MNRAGLPLNGIALRGRDLEGSTPNWGVALPAGPGTFGSDPAAPDPPPPFHPPCFAGRTFGTRTPEACQPVEYPASLS